MPENHHFQPKPRFVDILVFDGLQLLDLAGPLQVFATANELSGRAGPLYAPKVIAKADGRVTASAGLTSLTAPLPDADAPVHTLLVAGAPASMPRATMPILSPGSRGAPRARRGSRRCARAPSCWQRRAFSTVDAW